MYFSVLVPWSDAPTKWHPTSKSGPFSVLTRGAFSTEDAAHAWAKNNLEGHPYEVRLNDGGDVMFKPDNTIAEVLQIIEAAGLRLVRVGRRSTTERTRWDGEPPFIAVLEVQPAHRRDGIPYLFTKHGDDLIGALNSAFVAVQEAHRRHASP